MRNLAKNEETGMPYMAESIKSINGHFDRLEAKIEEGLLRLEQVAYERDRRYTENFKTVDDKAGLVKEAAGIAMAAAEKAIEKADVADQRKFESQNEFRAQMSDMQNTFARTDTIDGKLATLQVQIEDLKKYRYTSTGRGMALGEMGAWLAVAAAIGGTVAHMFFR